MAEPRTATGTRRVRATETVREHLPVRLGEAIARIVAAPQPISEQLDERDTRALEAVWRGSGRPSSCARG